MKKITLFINLTFLTVLAYLTAGILITTQGYGTSVELSFDRTVPIICGTFISSSENLERSQIYDQSSIPGNNTATGCLHGSGLSVFCIMTSEKRRRIRIVERA